MTYYRDRIPFSFHLTPWVKRLLVINGVAFVFGQVVGEGLIVEWFAFQPDRLFIRPWGLVSYMFVHGGFFHLLMNMLVLFFFGPPLEARWGSREFIRFYLVCGAGAALFSLLFLSSWIIGASGAVLGVMLAFAMNWPDAEIYIWGILPVKAKWLVTFLAAVALMGATEGSGGPVAHFAHLGGLAAAFIYLKMDRKRFAVPGRPRKRSSSSKKLAIVPREEPDGDRAWSRSPPKGGSDPDEEALLDAVDQVLDKISAHGMASLTDDERALLDRVSRRHRTN